MSEREPTIGPESKIKLGFLVPLIVAVAVPLILSYLSVRMELAAIRNDLQQIRQNMSDRWSGSMMILWAERLKHENAGKLVVPDVNRVREDMPLPPGPRSN
jgi:hypothetical protein